MIVFNLIKIIRGEQHLSMKVDFAKLRRVLSSPDCKTTKGKDSCECLSEYTAFIANYIETSHDLSAEELAMSVMSMQNWLTKKNYTKCKEPVELGDIFIADLGNSYKPECAYPHPVVILEKIGGLLLVAPVSSVSNIISSSYHPQDNPTGNKFYRRVYESDGFNKTCAIIVSNIRTISPGRLLGRKKGSLKDINNPNSIFVEVKEKAFELCFPKQFINYRHLKEGYDKLQEEYNKLQEEYAKLQEKVDNL